MPSPLDYATFEVPPPPPPLPLGRLWLWITIAFTTAALGITVTSAVLIGMWAGRDWPDMIDNDRIASVIDAQCDRMTQAVTDLAPRGSRHQVSEAIIAQDKAVQEMLDKVSHLDPALLASDKPTLAWVDDWERLIHAREQIALEIDNGRYPDLPELNDANGDPIFSRMEFAADCPIPDTLLNPYPDQSDNDV